MSFLLPPRIVIVSPAFKFSPDLERRLIRAIFNPGVRNLAGKVLPDMFASGLSRGADRHYLGHRPVISENPLVLGKEYVWQTYGQVDRRQRLVGSALEFKHKSRQAGEEFETVGIMSTWTEEMTRGRLRMRDGMGRKGGGGPNYCTLSSLD